MSHTIRVAELDNLPFMWDMLFEAAAVDPSTRQVGRKSALRLPATRKYLDGWGRKGDAGAVAFGESGEPLGAAWYRLFPLEEPGYGTISPNIPELTIGVVPGARGKGVGKALLIALMQLAREEGFSDLSLSVDRKNKALQLYQRLGFRDAGVSAPEDTSLTMAARL